MNTGSRMVIRITIRVALWASLIGLLIMMTGPIV